MKTGEDLIARYNQLYNEMVSSKDYRKMKIFGEAEKYMFNELAMTNPDAAERWLSHLEASSWNNYLSAREALNITKRFKNFDGTIGAHWSYDVLMRTVQSMGGKIENNPYYNSYALCITVNMIYSDHAPSIAEDMGYKAPTDVPNEKMALSCYKKAVEKLRDLDNNYHVREYFSSKMYDDSPM